MNNHTYTGFTKKWHNEGVPSVIEKHGRDRWHAIIPGMFYVTDIELIKYNDPACFVLLDGIIYKFRNGEFSDDQYHLLADGLSKNIKKTLLSLDGEYTLVYADLVRKIVNIAVSESGNAALYYFEGKDELIFGNSLSDLSGKVPNSVSLNYQRIYQVLSGQELGLSNSVYNEIHKLLPGNYMTLAAGAINIHPYSGLFETERNPGINEKEAFSNFSKLYREAVQKRMRSQRTGIALSSGKDSVSVAAIATNSLLKGGELFSYTSKPVYFPEGYKEDNSYDETVLLGDFFRQYPEIRSREVRVTAEGSLVKSFELSLKIFGEPIYGASNQYWIQEMHRMLKDDGCEQLLLGQGGNFTISWPPPELAFRNRGLKAILKDLLFLNKTEPDPLPYISREFVNTYRKTNKTFTSNKRNIHSLQPIFLKNSLSYTGSLQKQVSLHTDIFVTDPTVDKELIKFCLSLPYSAYHDKHNSRKLVTVAMKELIPEDILMNKVRGIQSSDIQFRIEAERDRLFEKLVFFSTNKLVKFVFEIERLIEDWDQLDFFKLNRKEINHFLRIFLVAMFLSKFED